MMMMIASSSIKYNNRWVVMTSMSSTRASSSSSMVSAFQLHHHLHHHKHRHLLLQQQHQRYYYLLFSTSTENNNNVNQYTNNTQTTPNNNVYNNNVNSINSNNNNNNNSNRTKDIFKDLLTSIDPNYIQQQQVSSPSIQERDKVNVVSKSNNNNNNNNNSTNTNTNSNNYNTINVSKEYTTLMKQIIKRELGHMNNNNHKYNQLLTNEELDIVKSYLLLQNVPIVPVSPNNNSNDMNDTNTNTTTRTRTIHNNKTISTSLHIAHYTNELRTVSRETVRKHLHDQQMKFIQYTHMTYNMYELYGRCLIYVNDLCAKQCMVLPSYIAWYKIRECGLIPKENAISTFLYVMSSSSTISFLSSSSSSSTSSTSSSLSLSNPPVLPQYKNINTNTMRQRLLRRQHPNTSTNSNPNQHDTNYNDDSRSDDGSNNHETDDITIACLDIALYHDLLYLPNEKTALVQIKSYINSHNMVAAEAVLNTLGTKQEYKELLKASRNQNTTTTNDTDIVTVQVSDGPRRNKTRESSTSYKRLRTYQPIYQYYCQNGQIIDAFRLYRDMQQTYGIHFVADTYCTILSALAQYGWFYPYQQVSPSILASYQSLQDLGYIQQHHSTSRTQNNIGPVALLDDICTEMANDIMELDESSVAMMINGFNIGFNHTKSNTISPTTNAAPVTMTKGWLSTISKWFQYLVQSNSYLPGSKNSHRRLIIERVSIDPQTAICPKTNIRLQLLTLSKEQTRNVHDSLLQMAKDEQQKFGSNNNNKKGTNNNNMKSKGSNSVVDNKRNQEARNATYALKELSHFSNWLRSRTGEAYTAFIDGPNIAYYGHGDVRWYQIELVMNRLIEIGENPLVIMPQKYLSPKFHIPSQGRTQELTKSDLLFARKLIDTKRMYVVPSSCLDDYYWMISSVVEQKPHPKLQHVPTNDKSGRLPGLRPLLVTNDQMRDHRLALLEPRLFRRWTSCHIVKYHIDPFDKDRNDQDRVTLFPADFFSREIQSNKANHLGDCTVWHFPVAEWPEPDRLCVSLIR